MRRPQCGLLRLGQRTDGATAVEFAIILTALLLILCGTMDFGNLYLKCNIASEAAREGARMAAVASGTTQTAVQTFVQTKFGNQLTVAMDPTTSATGSTVTVTVSNPITFFTPMISAFFPANYKAKGKTVMQVE